MKNFFNLVIMTSIISILGACASKAIYLKPPSSDQKVKNDVADCIVEARSGHASGIPLTKEEHQKVAEYKTHHLFFNGRPVLDGDTGEPVLAPKLASSGVSRDFSDRYALCFLSKGYTWSQSEK